MSYSFETSLELPRQYAPLELLALAADEEQQPEETTWIDVEVTFAPGVYAPASFSGHPDNWHPDESEDPEVYSVVVAGTGREVIDILTSDQIDELTRRAWDEQAEAAANDYYRDCDDWY